MTRLELGRTAVEYFTVIDHDYNFISGLSGFHTTLINPLQVVSEVGVDITEIGTGRYKAEFTPSMTGNWYLEVRDDTYFPYGKSDVIEVDTVEAMYNRLIGLNHENYSLESIAYNIDGRATQARIKLYPNSGLTGSTFAEYQATTTYDTNGNMTSHKVRRVV